MNRRHSDVIPYSEFWEGFAELLIICAVEALVQVSRSKMMMMVMKRIKNGMCVCVCVYVGSTVIIIIW